MQAMALCGEIATSFRVRKTARGASGARGANAAPPVDTAHKDARGVALDARTGVETAMERRGNQKSAAANRVQVLIVFSVRRIPQQAHVLWTEESDCYMGMGRPTCLESGGT